MKRLFNLSFLAAIFAFVLTYSKPSNAQLCQGDLVLSSQAQVDAFNCTEVQGDIIISGADITNLNALSSLTKVVGRLSIVDNPNLASLEGLSALRSIDDFLALALNPILTDVNALSALEQVGGLAISTNNSLSNLDGFVSLAGINKAGLSINDNPALINISGLDKLQTINGGVSIVNNRDLLSIKTFNNLKTLSDISIWQNENILDIDGFNSLLDVKELSIQWSSALATIRGFSGLTSVNNIQINENPKLSTIEGFSSLRSVSGGVFLAEDLELANISAFNDLDSIRGELRILSAGKLTDMTGLSSLKYSGSIKISNNDNLSNINGLTSLNELGQGDGSALIRGIAYSLEISSNDMLNNLDGLSSLIKASAPIRIFSNPKLESIDGFSSLTQIKGSLDIKNNPSLKSVNGFKQLVSITEFPLFGESGLILDGNILLSEFNGLSSLKELTGGQPVVQISNNNSLNNIDALSNLTSITGIAPTISIRNNSSLKNIDGFSSLSNVTDKELSLVINNNAALENIDGLASLGKEVQDTPSLIIVTQNALLKRCDGLLPYFLGLGVDEVLNLNALGRIRVNENGAGCTVEDIFSNGSIVVHICEGEVVLTHQAEIDAFNCEEVKGNLTISGDDITNLDSLSSLKKISGNLLIQKTINLKTIDGLSALDSITGSLLIVDNVGLTNINGFASLKSVGNVNMTGNFNVANLDGFSSLTEIRNGGIYISNNHNLVEISGPPSLHSINGGLIVENNTDLASINGFNNLVAAAEITITSNQRLDGINGFNSLKTIEGETNFPYLHPHDLTIELNNSLTNIEGFFALSSVNSIRITENSHLSNLGPFLSLKSVSGELFLSNNSALSTINGFNSLDSIASDLRIENNLELKTLTGFSSLRSAGNLIIRNDIKLIKLDGFSSLTKLYTGDFNDGELHVEFNESLNSITAFNNLKQVSAVSIYANPKLVSVTGFTSLVAIENKLGEAQGLPGVLSIGLNDDLTDIQGFSALTSVGSLNIYSNNSLATIDALSNLKRLGAGGLSISNNAALENLDGLSSLTDIYSATGGPIFVIVTQNTALNSCCGLRPLLERLGVTEANFYIQISENGSGCTVGDILACGPQKISKFAIIDLRTGQEVYSLENDSLTLDMANPDFSYWALQANTSPQQVGSVEFRFDDKIKHTENIFPYTFELPNHLRLGAHTVVANVYSEPNRKGVEGIGRTVTITFIKSTAVVSFDIVSTSGRFLAHLNEGDTIDFHDQKHKGQTIVANTTGRIGSVSFDLNDKFFNMQNAFPYTLTGDNYGIYFNPWKPRTGLYTLTATPYSKSNAGGTAGKSLTIHFAVVDRSNAIAGRMGTVGLEEDGVQNSDLIIYPVPVGDELFVKMDDTIGNDAVLSILTIQGLSIYEGTLSTSSSIRTSDLKPGVYILVVSNNGFQRIRKFIKK